MYKIIYKDWTVKNITDESIAISTLDSDNDFIAEAYDEDWVRVYTHKSFERCQAESYRYISDMKYPEFDKTSIAKAWINKWGNFITHLAHALYWADPVNEKKIRDAFSNYIEDYLNDIRIIEEDAWK